MKQKCKKLLSVFLSIVMLFSITAGVDLSAYAETSGDFNYSFLDDGTVEIFRYNGTETDLTIPSKLDGYTVTSIGRYAFYGCYNLTSITIPNCVTSIDEYAFLSCESLTSITIPNSVKSIGDYAFLECKRLTSVTIPNSVTNIGACAFDTCSRLRNVTIGNSVTSIGNYAFNYCENLTNVTIPNSVTSIGEGAFSHCINLSSVTIGNSVTSICDSTFYQCSRLTSITIPDSVTSIGDYAFYKCSLLGNVTIGNSVTSIGDYAFYQCENLTSITIPNKVTSIGRLAFYNCTFLSSVAIPNSVTSIGDSAFSGCYNLTDVHYASSQEEWNSISIGTLNSCLTDANIHYNDGIEDGDDSGEDTGDENELGSISVGETKAVNITTLGEYKFFLFEPAESGNYTFRAIGGYDTLGFVFDSDFNALSSDDNGNGDYNFSITYSFDAGVSYYLAAGFYDENVTGSFDVELVEASSSEDPEDPKDPEESDFCYSILDDMVEITEYYGSETDLIIPSEIEGCTVTSIGNYAFYNCTSLTSVTIPDSVKSIGESAFYSCESLTSVTIGNGITNLADEVFAWCTSLTNVTIPNSVTEIGNGAFYACDCLSSIIIPISVTSIGINAFYSCLDLENVYYYGTQEEWNRISIDSGNHCLTDAKIKYNYIPPCDVHTPATAVKENIKNATCTTAGSYDSVVYCSVCKAEISRTKKTVAKLGHNYKVTKSAKAATCTVNGNTEQKTCTRCNAVTGGAVIKATGHDYKTTTTEATQTADGKIVKKCLKCSYVASTTVIPKVSSITISTTKYTYDGNYKKPTVTVKDRKGNKLSTANYTVTYSNNKYVGKASVKVTLKGDYSGIKTLYFTINPKGTTLSTLTATSKGFKVTWKKQATQTTGYQIQYSTNSKFDNAKTVTVTSNSTTSKTISKLTAKKKYYVRVRTYKTVNGVNYYSNWSTTKSVTTKK